MAHPKVDLRSPAIFTACLALAAYFCFSAVQGENGVLRRTVLEAEATALRAKLETLDHKVAHMENKTRRLSDDYLDIDLLDQQARDILGLIRPDEVVIP